MFSPFKQNEAAPIDVKAIRQALLQAIKEQLQQWEGGEGGNIGSIHLFCAPAADAQAVYEAAMYAHEPERLHEEVQRIADDYALQLPTGWTIETAFVAELPPAATRAKNLPVALSIRAVGKKTQEIIHNKAYLKVLNGEAEQAQYHFTSEDGPVNIGREKMVQMSDGFYRKNHVAFPGQSTHPGNKFISRQHAHLVWNEESGGFVLFADEGGVPPRNKVKVRPRNGEMIKLQTPQIGYALQNGDQIMLGDSALLEFGYE